MGEHNNARGELIPGAGSHRKRGRRARLKTGNEAYAALRADEGKSAEFDKEAGAWERIGIIDAAESEDRRQEVDDEG